MSIAKSWFLDYGMKEGHDMKTLVNALDDGFVAFARRHSSEEEDAYIDQSVSFQQKQLDRLNNGHESKPLN